MRIICREYHHVTRIMYYDVNEDVLREDWKGPIEEFEAAINDESHEKHDEATDLMYQYGHDDEDEDWVTDRKGGFDVDWSVDYDES